MRVRHLRLLNFRNIAEASVSPCEGVTALVGANAQGKTNALEAVVLCCAGRSHRTPRDKELVKIGEEAALVELSAERNDGEHLVSIALSAAARKRVRVNGSAVARSGELMGHVTGVLFAPEDLRIVKDGPAERRRFVDMELSQICPAYYYALQRYARALQQRNRVLRDSFQQPGLLITLDAWDEQLAQSGAYIVEKRASFLEKLAREAAQRHADISGGREALEAAYRPNVDGGSEALLRALGEAKSADIRRGTTGVGPHHDDVTLLLNGRDARAFASQGQQRTVALALKLSELSVMREETGEWPTLLLDDVMSELDPDRRRALLSALGGVQTIVTCTDISDLAGASIGMRYRVEAGALTRED